MDLLMESQTSREIRMIAEIEKIWILYDQDNSGYLEIEEVKEYMSQVAKSHMKISDQELTAIFKAIDINGNNMISRDEMMDFMRQVMKEEIEYIRKSRRESERNLQGLRKK